MKKRTRPDSLMSIGLDLGDRYSYVVALERDGEVRYDGRVATKLEALVECFSQFPARTRVVCEAGTHSAWVSEALKKLGVDVIVANPTHAGRALAANGKKNDRLDATTLASLGFGLTHLLRPIKHRDRKAQDDLAVIRARHCVVRMRTQAINAVRGLVKTSGHRLPSCSAEAFHHAVLEAIPESLRPALEPLVEQIEKLTASIRSYDKQIEELCKRYPETNRLRAIKGIGPLISLAFVLTIEDPSRFKKSRDVGAYFGLVPAQHESGESSPQLRITKAGNGYMRDLLVAGAHYVLGPRGPDCDLRRFGERIGARGGKKGKKRAVTAVARKLAVLLHRLWVTGGVYDPFHQSKKHKHAKAS